MVGDFTGDGRQDISSRPQPCNGCVGGGDLDRNAVRLVAGRGGNRSPGVTYSDVVVGDFDGDGRDEIAGLTPQATGSSLCPPGPRSSRRRGAGPDRRLDRRARRRFQRRRQGRYCWPAVQRWSASDGSVSTVRRVCQRSLGDGFDHWAVQAVDLNQDARTDLIGQPTPGGPWSSVFLSTGTAFLPQQTWRSPTGRRSTLC